MVIWWDGEMVIKWNGDLVKQGRSWDFNIVGAEC